MEKGFEDLERISKKIMFRRTLEGVILISLLISIVFLSYDITGLTILNERTNPLILGPSFFILGLLSTYLYLRLS